jgi:hypothetical protein
MRLVPEVPRTPRSFGGRENIRGLPGEMLTAVAIIWPVTLRAVARKSTASAISSGLGPWPRGTDAP